MHHLPMVNGVDDLTVRFTEFVHDCLAVHSLVVELMGLPANLGEARLVGLVRIVFCACAVQADECEGTEQDDGEYAEPAADMTHMDDPLSLSIVLK